MLSDIAYWICRYIRDPLGLLPSLESSMKKAIAKEDLTYAEAYVITMKSTILHLNPDAFGATKSNILAIDGPMTARELDKKAKELSEEKPTA